MKSVKIKSQHYLECINHIKNQNKFYRIVLLDNDVVIQQNGRIGVGGGSSRVLGHGYSVYSKKIREKIHKEYKVKSDPHPHFIEDALNKYGYTIKMSKYSPEKIDNILNRIEKLEFIVKDACELSGNDIEIEFGSSYIKEIFNEIQYIKTKVKQEHKFTKEDIHSLNSINKEFTAYIRNKEKEVNS